MVYKTIVKVNHRNIPEGAETGIAQSFSQKRNRHIEKGGEHVSNYTLSATATDSKISYFPAKRSRTLPLDTYYRFKDVLFKHCSAACG